MVFLIVILSIVLLALVLAGVVEQRRHASNLDAIPLRILVNGIRGKSSVTRLCAGAMRGAGIRTLAKTTGTAARIIRPDGSERPVDRANGLANVCEQIKVTRDAVAEGAEALVAECMAVQPELQELSQDKLIRSNVAVITNVREDHLTEMGPSLADVARSLSRTMPVGGTCVTAEVDLFPVLAEEAERRNCRLVFADPGIVAADEMAAFSASVIRENVAVALTVARELGLDRQTALRGMLASAPDPGAATVEALAVGDKELRVANLFAANDPRSTAMNVQSLLERQAVTRPLYTLINCRADRVERSRQMAALLPALGAEKLFVIGHPTRAALTAIPREWDGPKFDLGGERRDPATIFQRIMDEVKDQASLLAIGNIHGQGQRLLSHVQGLRSAA